MEPDFIDIEDYQLEAKKIDQSIALINSKMQSLVFDYINMISGSMGNNDLYDLRSSLEYRLSCCTFLNELSENFRFQLEKSHIPNPLAIHPTMFRVHCTTDSLIFNLASVFDYLSSLIGYIIEGEKRKWNSLFKSIKNSAYKGSEIADIVQRTHREYTDVLFRYRSELIHYKSDRGAFLHKHYPKSEKVELHLFCSERFLSHFKSLKRIYPDKRITIRHANFWLIGNALKYCLELLSSLRIHIEANRIIEPGKEVITFKKPDGN
ncbi:MAG: hypothetical protein HEP71_23270 [Roseivirga sp.]|nr:hypothetical protein [Roseivirga sp.]